jgi:hypothetical protein
MNTLQRTLLWIDGLGGLIAGLITLLLCSWLSTLHGLPTSIILFVGIANLLYGSYSTPLAMRSTRPVALIRLLALANMAWGVVCVGLVIWHWETITVFGLIHILGEGLYVAGLGVVEWRWREALCVDGGLAGVSPG